MIRFFLPLFFLISALTAACVAQSGVLIQPPAADMPREQRREIALNAFAAGSAYEAGDEVAKALSAYRAALLYDDDPAIHFAAARCASSLGLSEEAAAHLRSASRDGNDNRVALRLLADIHVAAERYDSAATVYRLLVERDSSDEAATDMLAGLLEADNPYEATELYRRLLTMDHSAETAFRLARLYAERGSIDSSMSVIETLRKKEGDSDMILQGLSQLAAQHGDWPEAIQHLRLLRTRYPDDPVYALQLPEALLAVHQWSEAAELMRLSAGNDAVGQEDKIQIGKLFYGHAIEDLSTAGEALQLFAELHEQFPEDWRPLWFQGAVAYDIGNLQQATESFEAVVALTPGNAEAGNFLARSQLGLQRYDDVVETIEVLTEAGSATAESWLLLGYAWSSLGRDDNAVSALEQALDLDPSNLEVLSTLALAWDEMGASDKSDPLYARAVRGYNLEGTVKDDTYFLLLNNWSYALAMRDMRLDEALAMSMEATEHDPDNGSFQDTRAWVLYRLGHFQDALECALKAVALRQNSAVMFEHLGDIHHALGKSAEARVAWRRALELSPDNERIIELLQFQQSSNDN